MKKYLFSMLAWAITFSFVQAQTMEASETRNLPTFRKLKSGSIIEVVLIQGNEESAKVSTKNIDLVDVVTEVRGNELCLELKEKNHGRYRNNISVKIELTYKQLEAIDLSGAGSLKAESTVKAETLSIDLSGAGNMTLPVEARKLKADISGAGNINIKGKADSQEIGVSGAGNYKAYDLTTLNTKVDISGAGNAHVQVSGELTGDISGAGSLRYKGTPKKDIHTSGVGSAKHVD